MPFLPSPHIITSYQYLPHKTIFMDLHFLMTFFVHTYYLFTNIYLTKPFLWICIFFVHILLPFFVHMPLKPFLTLKDLQSTVHFGNGTLIPS